MSPRVCLVSTGQPSTNPRLVKEADALAARGYRVHMIGAHWAEWADRTDAELLASKAWSAEVIDWRREAAPWLFWKTRFRHRLARALFPAVGPRRALGTAAAGRMTPELTTAAVGWPADLYIAHNLGALPAAAAAARRHAAALGFDAEDYHAGQLADDETEAGAIVRAIEDEFVPRCDYVTAASPQIAEAYASRCQVDPTVILNVFPLVDRPAAPVPPKGKPLRLYWFSQTIGRDRGIDLALRAMGTLPAGSVELHLRGTWQAGFASELEGVARASGVRANQLVSYPPAAPSEMVRLAAEFDVGLALEPTRPVNADAALGNKIFTYVLAGLPVVASTTTAHADLLRHFGEAGVMVPTDDPIGLASALRRWLEKPSALCSARWSAWQLGTTRYNWDQEQERFLVVVHRVLSSRGARLPHGLAP